MCIRDRLKRELHHPQLKTSCYLSFGIEIVTVVPTLGLLCISSVPPHKASSLLFTLLSPKCCLLYTSYLILELILYIDYRKPLILLHLRASPVRTLAPRRGKPLWLAAFSLQKTRLRFTGCRSSIPKSLATFREPCF